MTKILTVNDISMLIKKEGFTEFQRGLLSKLKEVFSQWDQFHKIPRPAFHVPNGVIELMPIADTKYMAYKYVNGHPKNPELHNEMTIFATGALSQICDGKPLLLSEMTILTAMRTATTSVMAAQYLAKPHSKVLTMIGCGGQSEFQAMTFCDYFDIEVIRFFDIDPRAMQKFHTHMLELRPVKLIACDTIQFACEGADIITVCTAYKDQVTVLKDEYIHTGMHINAIGGDCPGKTELAVNILKRAKITVEFFEQSFIEGEIQNLTHEEAKNLVHSELLGASNSKKEGTHIRS